MLHSSTRYDYHYDYDNDYDDDSADKVFIKLNQKCSTTVPLYLHSALFLFSILILISSNFEDN